VITHAVGAMSPLLVISHEGSNKAMLGANPNQPYFERVIIFIIYMKKITEEKMHPLQFIWLWFGVRILKWKYIDIYSPDKDSVIAMTFSMDEEYIERIRALDKNNK